MANQTQAPSLKTHMDAKEQFYSRMIRQLNDDGFHSVADSLVDCLGIQQDPQVEENFLFKASEIYNDQKRFSKNISADDSQQNGTSKSQEDVTSKFGETNRSFTNPNWAPMNALLSLSVASLKHSQCQSERFVLDYSSRKFVKFSRDPPPFPMARERWTAAHKAMCTTVACTPDGQLCASGGDDQTVRVMSFRKGAAIKDVVASSRESSYKGRVWTRIFSGHSSPITSITFHPQLPIFFSGSKDGIVNVFDISRLETRRAEGCIQELNEVSCMFVHPCGDFLILGTSDPIIRIYDLNTLQCYMTMFSKNHHLKRVNDIRPSFNGRMFCSCSNDGSIQMWDSVSNSVINRIPDAHTGMPVTCVRWSKGMRYLLSSGLDGRSRIWDLRMGREVLVIGTGARNVHYNKSAFLHNEAYIVNINSEPHLNDLNLFDAFTGKFLTPLHCHPNRVYQLESIETANGVVTACADFRCRVIDILTSEHSSGNFGDSPVKSSGGVASRSAAVESEELSIDI